MTAVPSPSHRAPIASRRTARGWVAAALLALALALSVGRPAAASEAAPHGGTTTVQAPAAGNAHATAAGHAPAEDPNLIPPPAAPQIITVVTTLIVFLGLVAILSKYAWGPIVSGLKAREDKIRKDIREAEEARLRAERTLKEHQAQLDAAGQQVRELLAKANADAQQLATSIKMSAQQEAEEAKERATKDIEAAKNQALAEIYEQTAVLATSVAEKILRRNLNADDQRDLVRSSLDQLKGVNAN